MRLVRKVLGAILRPFYKSFFERPLWWFLARVKAYFLAEIGPQMAAMEERLRSTEANNAAQWSALEQLLLALFRQPEVRIESDGRISGLTLSAAGQDQIHERNNVR